MKSNTADVGNDNGRCRIPPEGWWCSREPGHDGPCAARPVGNQGRKVTETDALRAQNPDQCQAGCGVPLSEQHAKKQGAADGFQQGWHAALDRVVRGDRIADLRALIPHGPALPVDRPASKRGR
jgi:hypothetical protein